MFLQMFAVITRQFITRPNSQLLLGFAANRNMYRARMDSLQADSATADRRSAAVEKWQRDLP